MNTFKERTIISFILLVVLTMLPMDGYAYKLELQDSSSIRIEKIGHQYKNDTIFKFDKEALNSILIDEIVLSKNDGKTHPLFILCGNDTLLNKKAAKSLNQSELENGVNLLSTQNYVIKHGDNEWNLKFTEESIPPTEPVTQEISEPAPVEKSESSFPWWLTALLSLLLGAILGVGIMMWLLARNHKKKHKVKKNSGQPEDDSSQGDYLGSGLVEMPRKDQIEKELLDYLLSGEGTLTTRKDDIRLRLNKLEQLQEAFNKICKSLSIAEGSHVDTCIQKIEKLKQDQQVETPTTQQNQPAPQQSDCEEILKKIESKKDLIEIVNSAKHDITSIKPKDILMKFVEILPSKVRNARSQQIPQKQNEEITESLLNTGDHNRRVATQWAIGKLIDAGFQGFNKNQPAGFVEKLQELAQKLNAPEPKVVDVPREADEKIVSRFIHEDKLSEDDKKILLARLIEKMNGQIDSEDAKLDTNLSLEDYLRRVIEKLQTPNSHEEARAIEKKNNIAAVNQLLGSELEDFDSNALKVALEQAILQQLKDKFNLSAAASLDDIISRWKQSESQADQLTALIGKYKVEKAKEVPDAVLNKELEGIKKPIAAKLQEILPDQPLESLQKLVNQLLAKADSYKKDYEAVTDELEESLASRDSEFTSNNQKASELLSLLIKSVKNKEFTLTSTIKDRDNTIEGLNATIDGNKTRISNLEQEKEMLMTPSAQLVDALHEKAAAVRDAMKTILNPCSDADEAQCIDIEDRLFNGLKQFVEQVHSFNVDINTTPVETRKQAQRLLVNGIIQDNSAINTICRYYAYSRLPFMTDTSREYGITFKRRNMVELFNSIANMYTMLGINFEIPSLFVMGLDDGDFENMTGQAYGDLDNLCQNSRNHFDNIDSKVKPANVIVDIVNVGYSIDGQNVRKPSVLTY